MAPYVCASRGFRFIAVAALAGVITWSMLSTGGMPSRDVALVRVDGGSRQPGVEEGGRVVCPHQKQFRYEGVVRGRVVPFAAAP
jgi:hypothetical protein